MPGRSQRGWGWLGEISDALVSMVFPSGCRICEKLLTTASRVPLCEECLSSFERVPSIVCDVCGRPLPGLAQKEEEPLLCPACREKTYAFDRARSFALYKDVVVRAILLLKFEQIEPLGAWLAGRLAELVSTEGEVWRRTWWFQYLCIASARRNEGTTRRHCSQGPWREGCDCRTEPCC